MLAYICDEKLKQELNKNKQNYWDVYIREINDLLGIRARVLSIRELEDIDRLEGIGTLIIGHDSATQLTDRMREVLAEWVSAGGMLIGFAVDGLDHVFGMQPVGAIKQQPDDYAISAYFELWPHQITHEVHPALSFEQRLFALSDIRLVKPEGSIELARLYDSAGRDLGCPAITWNRYGEGYAGYFAFDVAKTIWLLHQGRPVPASDDTKKYPKTSQLQVLGDNSRKIPYADEITLILQNMISHNPQPFIYQIPPLGEEIPDALLYWGGDEYHGPVERSLKASDWMKQKGLPYHINMCDNHPITPEQLHHIKQNGHEVSLYYQLHEEDNFAMKEEYYIELNDLFHEKIGFRPLCTVNKWLGWSGWAEPAKWMLKAGGRADNSFYGNPAAHDHPFSNGPSFAFGFGTSYPFNFYDDYEHENQRIDFIEEPIVCYEIGHRGSITGKDKETRAVEDVHAPIDLAVKYHLLMNMFYHPIYISYYPRCREAIEEILRYIEYIGARVLHLGNDQVCKWWYARSHSAIDAVISQENSIRFECNCEYIPGMIVKIPVSGDSELQVLLDGRVASYKEKQEFGRRWIYVVVPAGRSKVEIIGKF